MTDLTFCEIIDSKIIKTCYIAYNNYHISNVVFDNINSSSDGSAIRFNSTESNVSIISSFFHKCITTRNYGTICIESKSLTTSRNFFHKCVAYYVASIFSKGVINGEYVITQSEFILDESIHDIFFEKSSIFIRSLNFTKDSPEHDGHLIYISYSPRYVDVKYVNAKARQNGGAPLFLSSSVKDDSVFAGNTVIIGSQVEILCVWYCHAKINELSTINCSGSLVTSYVDGFAIISNSHICKDIFVNRSICSTENCDVKEGTTFEGAFNIFLFPGKQTGCKRIGIMTLVSFYLISFIAPFN